MTDPSLHDFSSWVDGPCEVESGEGRLPMLLLAAEPLEGSPRAGGGFRLEFLGPPAPVLDQAIRTVTAGSGRWDIFMVPISRHQAGTRYEAVFY